MTSLNNGLGHTILGQGCMKHLHLRAYPGRMLRRETALWKKLLRPRRRGGCSQSCTSLKVSPSKPFPELTPISEEAVSEPHHYRVEQLWKMRKCDNHTFARTMDENDFTRRAMDENEWIENIVSVD